MLLKKPHKSKEEPMVAKVDVVPAGKTTREGIIEHEDETTGAGGAQMRTKTSLLWLMLQLLKV